MFHRNDSSFFPPFSLSIKSHIHQLAIAALLLNTFAHSERDEVRVTHKNERIRRMDGALPWCPGTSNKHSKQGQQPRRALFFFFFHFHTAPVYKSWRWGTFWCNSFAAWWMINEWEETSRGALEFRLVRTGAHNTALIALRKWQLSTDLALYGRNGSRLDRKCLLQKNIVSCTIR
jgi:hypothetical protein